MLVEVTIGNYRSFKEKATLSLVASGYDKTTHENENVIPFEKFDLRLLKSAVLYGANASGKTKFFEGVGFLKNLALNSLMGNQVGKPINVHPFALDKDSVSKPSFFELVFTVNGNLYRYGLEVTHESVKSEWLFMKELRKEVKIFSKDEDGYFFHPTKFKQGKILEKEKLLRENATILSTASIFPNPIIEVVSNWFRKLHVLSGIEDSGYRGYTLNYCEDSNAAKKVIEFLNQADLDINEIQTTKYHPDELPADIPQEILQLIKRDFKEKNTHLFGNVITKHVKYDELGRTIGHTEFKMEMDESSGTNKFFALAGPLLDSLEKGNILFIDELDAKMHPLLVQKIVELFHKGENKSQLILNTHTTTLLDENLFRRDQIWFAEKDRYGCSTLFSLLEIKNTNREANWQEKYLQGRYGAIPYLRN
ncbi:ATP-binding protein [Flavobacterium filum]|uniref:AAA family ATPase n=1 Tax=Flavobacterium filum TaxID=370974 RepID=UPI0023F37F48|nr:ATP-binding protein [Flavobacterium filum]